MVFAGVQRVERISAASAFRYQAYRSLRRGTKESMRVLWLTKSDNASASARLAGETFAA